MQYFPLEKTIMAVVVVICVSLIEFWLESSHRKKILKKCVADAANANTFVFKGKTYSKEKYIIIKSADYKKVKPAALDKMIKNYLKSYEKGKLTDLQILELNAMQLARNKKQNT